MSTKDEATSGRRTNNEWAKCSLCDAKPKAKNHERHFREKHPEEYLDEYPDAAEKGIAPCPVCWKWLSVRDEVVASRWTEQKMFSEHEVQVNVPELDHHIATEHPDQFEEECPGMCILCTIGLMGRKWPPFEGDVADFIWKSDGSEIRWGAAAAWLSQEAGTEVTEEQAKMHTEHASPVFKITDDEAVRTGYELGNVLAKPTKIEVDVYMETEEGEEYTVAELADITGRSERGIRERETDLVEMNILEVADDGRPKVFRATGEHTYDDDSFERTADDSDPADTDWEPESFEKLHGGHYISGRGP